MKEKTINTIKIVVALVLLAGIGVGLFFGGRWFIGELDGIFPAEDTEQTDDTDNPSGGEQSGTDQSGGDATAQAFYVGSNGYGYRTIDGVTVFFKKVVFSDQQIDTDCYADTVKLFYDSYKVVPYGSFLVKVRWSTDSILWSDFNYGCDNIGGVVTNEAWYADVPHDLGEVYISYTFVTNCANPMMVLSDLVANAYDYGVSSGGVEYPMLVCSKCAGLG